MEALDRGTTMNRFLEFYWSRIYIMIWLKKMHCALWEESGCNKLASQHKMHNVDEDMGVQTAFTILLCNTFKYSQFKQ